MKTPKNVLFYLFFFFFRKYNYIEEKQLKKSENKKKNKCRTNASPSFQGMLMSVTPGCPLPPVGGLSGPDYDDRGVSPAKLGHDIPKFVQTSMQTSKVLSQYWNLCCCQRRRADKDEIVESTSMRRQELRRERREVGGRNGVQERGEYGGGMR